jgi:hypothetical protein
MHVFIVLLFVYFGTLPFESLQRNMHRWRSLFEKSAFTWGKRLNRFIGDLLALKTGNPDITFEDPGHYFVLCCFI